MTATPSTSPAPTPAPEASNRPGARLPWVRGTWLVARLELAQRMRSKKTLVALILWFVVIGAVTLLMLAAFTGQHAQSREISFGPAAFGIITLFVLGLALLVAPSFTAMSINGDRDAGTLAILQATRLGATQLASGKLLAAWLLALGFLVAALPWVVLTTVLGGISAIQVVVCFLVMFLEVAVVCAIGLGWSALVGRPAGSTVMTYASVALLTFILPIAMGFAAMLSVHDRTVTDWRFDNGTPAGFTGQVKAWQDSGFAAAKRPDWTGCTPHQSTEPAPQMDRLWWMVAPNPFVVVADAAPLPAEARGDLMTWVARSGDPLAAISSLVRSMAVPTATQRDQCVWELTSVYDDGWVPTFQVAGGVNGSAIVTDANGRILETGSPVPPAPLTAYNPIWPWGVSANLLLGGLMFWIATRRLSVPYGTLPRGTRVA